ncbi:hypothetical protein KCP78_14180 [Salmonella enterica subsp. enterica]|nr:hypothetical protein KCP78_14180 [Salmonella enterica subsp. enterica]
MVPLQQVFYGTATYFTGTETASTMDSKLIPTALDASFDGDIITHNIEKSILEALIELQYHIYFILLAMGIYAVAMIACTLMKMPK